MNRLAIRVKPGSHRTEVTRLDQAQEVLLVRVRAKAVDGAANAAVIKVVAGALGLRRSSVAIARGSRSRVKLLDIDVGAEDLAAAIAALPAENPG